MTTGACFYGWWLPNPPTEIVNELVEFRWDDTQVVPYETL